MKHPKNLWDLVLYHLWGTAKNRRDTIRFMVVLSPIVYLLCKLPLYILRWVVFCEYMFLAGLIQYIKRKWDL